MTEVFGIQAARAVLNENPERARNLYILVGRRDARVNELISLAKENGVRFQSLKREAFERRLEDVSVAHQGVVLECKDLTTHGEKALLEHVKTLESPFILVLDGLTDPRNLGACLRSANAAGVDAVLLPKRNSAPLNDVALKTAQGGAEQLFIAEVSNLARVIKALKNQGVWVFGADGDAEQSHTSADFTAPCALVMGNEGKGLRRLTKELCDHLVAIPMRGTVASLNVSVATGILLFEITRQRA